MEQFVKNGIDFVSTYGGKIVLAILVFIVGYFVIKLLNKAAGKAIDRTSLTPRCVSFRKRP